MFAPPDKEKLGTRYSCFECGTKFYDLTKPEPYQAMLSELQGHFA